MRYSVNDFNRAMSDVDTSVVEQNRAVEQMNYDIVDIVNRVMEADGAAVTHVPLRTPQDVAFVLAQCSAKLRIILSDKKRGQ